MVDLVTLLRQQSKLGPINVPRAAMRDAADRIEALERELAVARAARDEAIVDSASLLAVIADIRMKSGVGARPMLSELAEAVAAVIIASRVRMEEAERRYVDANEARLDCIRALHEVVEAMMPGQARRIARAALSQKETGHGA